MHEQGDKNLGHSLLFEDEDVALKTSVDGIVNSLVVDDKVLPLVASITANGLDNTTVIISELKKTIISCFEFIFDLD